MLESYYSAIIETIGEDLQREGLRKTPSRAAETIEFLTQGYRQSVADIVNGAVFPSDMDEMVIVKGIELYSLCEHHLLSKIARVVDIFARRLQIQERLTQEIAHCILESTEASGVGVIIEAQHLCMMMRGVAKQQATMTTSMMLGGFRDDARTRLEFLNLIQKK